MEENAFLDIVQQEAHLKNREEAKTATLVVFDLLHHEITTDEAKEIKRELPEDLAKIWEGGHFWLDRIFSRLRPSTRFNGKEFIDQVNARKGDLLATGEDITYAVLFALQQQLSDEENEALAIQLPSELQQMWRSAGGSDIQSLPETLIEVEVETIVVGFEAENER